MDSPDPLPDFRKHGDDFIAHLGAVLATGEAATAAGLPAVPERPVLFVVGPPRSGTTVLMQWLAALGDFAVPSNLAARFPTTPLIGGMLQRLLSDPALNYQGELSVPAPDFTSNAGKTTGVLAPHEYFYFWRRFFPLDAARPLTEGERQRVDIRGFARGLAALETGLAKPVALKAIIAQYDLDLIAQAVPTAVFLVTHRDEIDNVDSLLNARRAVFGTEEEWFSVRPAGSETVQAEHDAVVQAAAQVAWTNDDIDRQLQSLASDRVVRVDHSAFCQCPARVFDAIRNVVDGSNINLAKYSGPATFDEHKRRSSRTDEISAALVTARNINRLQDSSA